MTMIIVLLFYTERVRQIQEKLEEFIHALNKEKWVQFIRLYLWYNYSYQFLFLKINITQIMFLKHVSKVLCAEV
jgi:hypothetical protein